jgi:Zn-dependent protease with chaperone function
MRSNTLLAIVLIVAGIAVFIYQGFTYKTREKVVDLGSVHVMADRTKMISIPPILGALAIVGGVAWLLFDGKQH